MTKLTEIRQELFTIDALQIKAKFNCISDQVANYTFKEGGTKHELNIIADDCLFRNMKVCDIINSKRIDFLEHVIYLKNNDEWEVIHREVYAPKVK